MQQIGHRSGGRSFFITEFRGRARIGDVKRHRPQKARRTQKETLTVERRASVLRVLCRLMMFVSVTYRTVAWPALAGR